MTDKDKKINRKLLADQMYAKAAAETKKNTAFSLSGANHSLTIKSQSTIFSFEFSNFNQTNKICHAEKRKPEGPSTMDTYRKSKKEESNSDEESSTDEGVFPTPVFACWKIQFYPI